MTHLFEQLFRSDFMPHGHCYLWNPAVLWLNVGSDLLICVSYFSIPLALSVFVRRRKDLVFNWMFVLFAIFILACGTTHAMAIWNVWHGTYGVTGVIKLITAASSAITAVLLWPLIPRALEIPSHAQLAEANAKLTKEIEHRLAAEIALKKLNIELERKIEEATEGLRTLLTKSQAAERALTAQQRYFSELANALPQVVWGATADGQIDYHNRRWYEVTGSNNATMDVWSSIIHPEDRENTLRSWASSLSQKEPFEAEYRILDKDGHYRWHLGRAVPVPGEEDGVIRWFGTSTDIDAQKRSEEARSNLLVREREARSVAEHASRMKDEFLATLSHELRTPLNAILGWSQLLRRKRSDEQMLNQGLDTIERNAKAQAQIVDDLLDMNRIISGRIRLEPKEVSVEEVIHAAVDGIRPSAEAKEIPVAVQIVPPLKNVWADPARLQQIFWNLLTNSVKFTPRGGHITVSARTEETEELVVCITDTGKGIAPEFLPMVFDRFSQADASTTRRFGGLGLGLSIVQNLIELHGGSVSAHSLGEGHGTTIEVRLPFSARIDVIDDAKQVATSSTPSRVDLSPGSLRGIRVLAVDDESDARILVQQMLEEWEATVKTASSGKEALELLAIFKPDAIVSDISMPEMDGYEFIRRVRALDKDSGGNIPALAVTAFARTEDHDRSLEAGYQIHIAKPVDPVELVAGIRKVLLS